MKSNDFVKYLTVQLVEKMDKPKQKRSKKSTSLSSHWFGLIPMSIKMVAKRFQKNN